MGTITFETQASSVFLSCQLDREEQLDSVVKGMLDNNRIPGLLKPVFSRVDDVRSFRYDVTAYVSLRELCRDGIRLRSLIRIMLGIADCLDRMEEYLIPASSCLLEPEYIFAESRSMEAGIVCLPVLRDVPPVSYSEFFLDLLTRNRVDTEQYGRYYPEIINYLNEHRGRLALRDYANLLQRFWNEILAGEPEPSGGYLTHSVSGEVIELSQAVTRIGRDPRYADRVIDNKHVSSQHARIEQRDGRYTVVDEGSSNGTFLNGRRLERKQPAALRDGDVLAFAREQYVFHSERGTGQTGPARGEEPRRPAAAGNEVPQAPYAPQPPRAGGQPQAAEVPVPPAEGEKKQKKIGVFGFGGTPKGQKPEKAPHKERAEKPGRNEEKKDRKKTGGVIGGGFIPGKGKVGGPAPAADHSSGGAASAAPPRQQAEAPAPAQEVNFGHTIYLSGEKEGTQTTGTT